MKTVEIPTMQCSAMEEVKDQSSNGIISDISKIDLANGIHGMSDKDKYEFNYRLWCMLPFTFIIFLTYFNYILVVLNIVYHAVLILFCFAIFIVCRIYKKPFKKFANTLVGFVSSNNPNGVEFEHRQYVGLWLFVSILYSSVVAILDDIYDDITNRDLRISIVTRISPFALNLTFIVFYKTVKCHQKIMDQKKSVLEKYKNTEKIQDKIEESLQDWRKSKQLINRKIEVIVLFLWVFFWHFILTAIVDWNIYKNHDPPTAVLITLIFLFDSCFLVVIFYWVNTAYLHYKFPAIIMDGLAAPINAETTNDLIGWWQLRKFYAQSIVKMYTSSMSVAITALIFASIVLALFLFENMLFADDMEIIEMVTTTMSVCYVISIMFLVVSTATDYHANQVSHANMLRVESMALRKYKADNINSINDIYDIELRKYENDIQQFVVNQLIQDVENNSDVIHVLGISINYNFMLLLRAGLGTLGIAIISVLFS